ncbi:hypothetical protein IW261DRAFT_1425315 [Armillaria novae-zelandiae]|uniref:Uncharacterized protein n=1 Tax=Armillaria novae-zelandiae TaxID=153914 RepID=A0AA39NT37_9AGAR|nr:hypothetical protein IW261DRAFT_1425315 [Armillaria novae-zelandiae]
MSNGKPKTGVAVLQRRDHRVNPHVAETALIEREGRKGVPHAISTGFKGGQIGLPSFKEREEVEETTPYQLGRGPERSSPQESWKRDKDVLLRQPSMPEPCEKIEVDRIRKAIGHRWRWNKRRQLEWYPGREVVDQWTVPSVQCNLQRWMDGGPARCFPEISIPTWLLLSPLYWWNTAGELGMSRINGPVTTQQTFSIFDENGTLKGSASVVTYGSTNHIAVREVKGAKNMNKDISGETETRRRLIALSKDRSTEGTRI